MIEAAQHLSLVTQVAGILRKAIQEGEWAGRLPGERTLSDELQVSRPTLRKAIEILQEKGILATAHGRGTRILRQPIEKERGKEQSKAVGFLCPWPLDKLSHISLFLIAELQRHLADAGCRLEIHAEARFRQKHPLATLERLVNESRAVCWILHSSTYEIQNWFSRRRKPAIVSKIRHAGVRLPCIDCDYSAIAQHAAKRFIALGHRHIVILSGKERAAHDVVLEEGFQNAFGAPGASAHEPSVVLHGDSVADVRSVMTRIFESKNPPTGLMVPSAAPALAALGYLTASGIRVPEDVSLVCGMDDPFLSYCIPSITRYRVNIQAYARRLSRMVMQALSSEEIKADLVQIEPEFIRGETLGPARSGILPATTGR